MPRVFGPRNVVEAAFLVAAPVIALTAGLSAWPIVGVSAAAYLLVLAVEASLKRSRAAEPERVDPPEPAHRSEHVHVLRAAADPEPAPVERRVKTNVVPIGVAGGARRWSIWDLERVARQHRGGDAAVDEERIYLLLYLREFAGADGLLPTDFDSLVRESFGDLVGA